MSFPNLELQVTTFKPQILGNIQVSFEDFEVTGVGTYLIRDRYEVRRNFAKSTGGTGLPKKDPKIPVDVVRLEYTWVGHCDVTTESVSRLNLTSTNMNLIESCVALSGDIPYSYPSPTTALETDPSLAYTNVLGSEGGPFESPEVPSIWYYKKTNDVFVESPHKWLISSVSVVDNQDATSRVTFTFKSFSNWQVLSDVLDYNISP